MSGSAGAESSQQGLGRAAPDSLGGGLVRRWSTAADTERLAALMGLVFRDHEDELPNPRSMAWARRLMGPGFPYMTPEDVAVVEDTGRADRPLVACTTFWRHRWSYGGIPFAVTRPEMVGTHPDYRRRGLVRAMFEMIHARSDAEGHLLQAITGVPYFYRQLGYEYVLELEGGRTVFLSLVPEREEGEPERCSLRRATLDDVEQMRAIYDRRRGGSLVWHEDPERFWRFQIAAASDEEAAGLDLQNGAAEGRFWMIVDAGGTTCGYLWAAARRWSAALAVSDVGFAANADLPALVPSLLRRLAELARQTPAVRPTTPACSEISFTIDRAHPLQDLLGDALAPRVEPPYAWYIRIPDPAAFIRHVGTVLEARLAASPLARYSGDVKLDLYRAGLRLRFERGELRAVEPWQAPIPDTEEAALGCPPLVFTQLLLGYRSLDDLLGIYPDVQVKAPQRLVITTLFAKEPSIVQPHG